MRPCNDHLYVIEHVRQIKQAITGCDVHHEPIADRPLEEWHVQTRFERDIQNYDHADQTGADTCDGRNVIRIEPLTVQTPHWNLTG